tara:strand:+ start:422 stop:874 length:453 start_codon:yes stop_codon:yes gene_type:complete
MNKEIINNDENNIDNFIKKEKKQLIDFLSGFEIIGLTIASIIGLSVSSLSKTFTEQIIMPLLEPLFDKNWKTFTLNIGESKLGIGLFLSDILYLTIIVFTMYIIYSLFKTYLSNVIDKKHNTNIKFENKLIKELSYIRKELKNNKKSNEV